MTALASGPRQTGPAGSQRPDSGRQPGTLVIMAWALLASLLGSWLAWRVALPLEIDRNEAWNAWFTAQAFDPSKLYPQLNELIVNNYPPLSFVFIKAVSYPLDVITTGRIVSLLAIIFIAICVVGITKTLGAPARSATIAGLWTVALFFGLFAGYAGMNDPNLLSLAIMLAGLWLFMHTSTHGKTPYAGCAVMAVALFFKHSIIVFPIAALLWHFSYRPASAMRAALCLVGLGCLGVLLCQLVYGDAFLQQLRFPRLMQLSSGFRFFRKLPPLLPAIILWWQWSPAPALLAARRFTGLALLLALVLNFLQQCGAGVDYNATFEFVIAAGLALGCALQGGERKSKVTQVWLVLLLILFSNRLEPYLFITSPQYRNQVREQVSVSNQEIARIRALPGPTVCDVLSACVRAGKSFEFDGYAMSQRVATATWRAEQLEQALAVRQLRFVTVAPDTQWTHRTFVSEWRR